jgi:hypothetical protein
MTQLRIINGKAQPVFTIRVVGGPHDGDETPYLNRRPGMELREPRTLRIALHQDIPGYPRGRYVYRRPLFARRLKDGEMRVFRYVGRYEG